jgi:hypothetical protein
MKHSGPDQRTKGLGTPEAHITGHCTIHLRLSALYLSVAEPITPSPRTDALRSSAGADLRAGLAIEQRTAPDHLLPPFHLPAILGLCARDISNTPGSNSMN